MGFWRKHLAVVDVRGDCGTWRRGDLAVCIGDHWQPREDTSPRKGDVLRVVGIHDYAAHGVYSTFLEFEAKPLNIAWDARGFRKAVSDNHAADADFVLELRREQTVDA